MFIDDEVLENIYKTFENVKIIKGREIFRTNKVKLSRIKYLDSKKFTLFSKVSGSLGEYKVEVDVVDAKIFYNKCTCPDSLQNNNDCKHIVATLFEFILNKEYEKRFLVSSGVSTTPIKSNFNVERYNITKNILNRLEGQAQNLNLIENTESINGQNVRLIPKLYINKYFDMLEVEFSIGTKQLYKLKDLVKFYECTKNNLNYKYGMNLEFVHNVDNFDAKSQKLMSFISRCGEMLEYATNNVTIDYQSSKGQNGRIKLNSKMLDEFFEIVEEQDIKVESFGHESNYKLFKVPIDINFEIESKDTEYRLTTNLDKEYRQFKGKDYTYIFYNYNIYRCSKDMQGVLEIQNEFNANNIKEMYIDSKDISRFFSVVVPKIKSNLNLDKLSKEELDKYLPKELLARMFLDIDNKYNVIANVLFKYEDISFNPFKDEPSNIVRNYDLESKIKQNLANTGFEYDKVKDTLVLKSEEKIYHFFTQGINEYTSKMEIMITDKFKQKQLKQPRIGNIGIRVENNLLNIDFKELDFDIAELKQILQNYNLKKKYYRLKNGNFLNLDENEDIEFLSDITSGMDIEYKNIKDNTIRVPIYRTMYLEKILDKLKNTEIVKNDEYKKIINKTEDKEENENILIPDSMQQILRTYQKTGFKWLKILDDYKFGGILADDMGLGKTIQIITLILDYINSTNVNEKKPSIVVSPSSVTLNWRNEILKYAPTLKVLVITGKSAERTLKLDKALDYDVVITSYDLLKRDSDYYETLNYNFKYIIADEAQYIKNSKSQNAMALKRLVGETRYALTGTPIENSLGELWSIFDYILPGYLFSYNKFKQFFETPILKLEDNNAMKKLKLLIEPFVLRRLKKEVLTELPDKTITVLNNEMTSEQNKIYLAYLNKAKQELKEEVEKNGFEKNQIKILSIITRLRQICCHPSLFIENYKGESSKLNQCIDLIIEAISSNHKILVFSQFSAMFKIIEDRLNEQKIKYYKLVGSTKVEERIKLVDSFNKSNDTNVFLISLKAGGTGLNLTGADVVIHFDPWWNLAAQNQATDRAYRIGQKNNVQVYKLITENTIEEKINLLQAKKASLAESVLSTEEVFINKLSKEEIMSLFEI